MRGLNGNEAAQPRVFAHDMVPIAIGAINPRQEGTGASLNGIANGLEMTSGGTGYTAGSTITLDTGGAGTTKAQVKVLTVDGGGAITSFELAIQTTTANTPYGEGYVVGDTLTETTIGGATFTVRNIDLPNTHERGCCLYAGIAIDTGLALILESGKLYNTASTATLKGITAGSFLPVLAKRVVSVTLSSGSYANGDLLAIY